MNNYGNITQVKFYFDRNYEQGSGGVASLQIVNDVQKTRIACLLDRDKIRCQPFVYDIPDTFKGKETKLARQDRLVELGQASFANDKPRVVFSGDTLRLDAMNGLDIYVKTAPLITDMAEVVFMPQGTRNTRRLTDFVYDLLYPAPDVIVLGLGLQDYLVDNRNGQCQVDIDEFTIRLSWILEVIVKDFNTGVVFVLAPPVGETIDTKKNVLLSAEAARPYMKIARTLVEKYAQKVVNYEDHYTLLKPLTIRRLSDATATAIRESLQVARFGIVHGFYPLSGIEQVSANLYEGTPYQANPIVAEMIFESQSNVSKYTGNQIEKLLFALSSETKIESDADEGNGLGSGKTLGNVGGRNEFEKSVQRSIIRDLQQSHKPGRKNTLIIGDSIRMRLADSTGYGIHAYELLKPLTNLYHIPHNCGSTVSALHYLEDWISCRPNIVHINVGLHDLVFGLDGKTPESYIPVEKYHENVYKILQRLQAAGIETVIWGLNTPVCEARHNNLDKSLGKVRRRLGRRNADIRAYNDAALTAADSLGVQVTDMFTPLWEAGVENTLVADGVHLNHQGSVILGALVANVVKEHL